MTLTRFEFTRRVRPILEVGLGSTVIQEVAALWDVALWDAPGSIWNGDEPLWRDVSCDIISVHLEQGRGRVSDAFKVGEAEVVVDNESGWADPSEDFEYDTTTSFHLRPGRALRVGVIHQTLGTCWLWRGFIDEIEPSDSADDWSTVRLRCIDALGEAGRAKLAEVVETGAGEESRTRFGRILDAIRWPSTKRVASVAAIRDLYATELDGQVVDLLRQTANSEGGWVFGDNNGDVVLQDRDWLYFETADVDATIGNGAAGDVCPTAWRRSFARRDMATRIIFQRDLPDASPDEDPLILNDPTPQVLYGVEPYERRDLWTMNATEYFQNAARVLATRSAALSMPRIEAVTIDAAAGNDETKRNARIDLLCELSVFTPSRYRGRLVVDGATRFDDAFFAVGVEHTISADEWVAHVSLDRATPYERLDPDTYVWDVARWDRSLWN